MKATQSEIKENIQGTNSEGKETGTQINDLEQKEKISIQLEQNKETRRQKTKKKKRRLRNIWDNFKRSKSKLWECWKENREREIFKKKRERFSGTTIKDTWTKPRVGGGIREGR